ncbi:MAG: SRPBCC family protein [Thermoanaerobaculia bacterium]
MSGIGELTVLAQGDREIVMSRVFSAPRELVFKAWTQPAFLKRWLTGPPQWSLEVCEIDLRVGGQGRFVWRHRESGAEMGLTNVYREILPPARLVATERFDEPWYPGEAIGTIELFEINGQTLLRQTLLYDSQETRDAVLESPMESGVAFSFDQLEALLPAMVSAER